MFESSQLEPELAVFPRPLPAEKGASTPHHCLFLSSFTVPYRNKSWSFFSRTTMTH